MFPAVHFAIGFHFEAIGISALDGAHSGNHFHTGFFHFGTDTGNQHFYHAVFPFNHFLLVDGSTGTSNAVYVAVIAVVKHFGRVQQGFGRNATFVQANTAQSPFFNQQSFETALCGTFGSIVTTGATAQYD